MYAVLSAIMYAAAYANGANGVNSANGANTVNGANGAWGWSWWWWVAVAVIVLVFIGAFSWRPSQPPKRMPEEILKERFARGEITQQEYEEQLKILRGGR